MTQMHALLMCCTTPWLLHYKRVFFLPLFSGKFEERFVNKHEQILESPRSLCFRLNYVFNRLVSVGFKENLEIT